MAHSNGRTVEAIFEPYCDKDAYDRGEQINTTFETERITFDVGVNEQTLTDVYLHIIAELNNLGYITTII